MTVHALRAHVCVCVLAVGRLSAARDEIQYLKIQLEEARQVSATKDVMLGILREENEAKKVHSSASRRSEDCVEVVGMVTHPVAARWGGIVVDTEQGLPEKVQLLTLEHDKLKADYEQLLQRYLKRTEQEAEMVLVDGDGHVAIGD